MPLEYREIPSSLKKRAGRQSPFAETDPWIAKAREGAGCRNARNKWHTEPFPLNKGLGA